MVILSLRKLWRLRSCFNPTRLTTRKKQQKRGDAMAGENTVVKDGTADDHQYRHHHHHHQPDSMTATVPTMSVSPMVKTSVFVGIFLLRILSSVPWVWGNLAAYVTSYYYAEGDLTSGSLTSWIISVEVITFNFAMTIGNPVATRIGQRTTLLLGLMLFNGGIFLTYFAVKHSAVSLCVTFAGMTGFAGGITEAVQLVLIVRWTERYHGLSTSSVQSSVVLGGIVLNFVLTAYINPNNEEANATIDRKAVFTQSDLVERVPSVFLLYGVLSTVFNFLGFFLVRDKPGDTDFCVGVMRRVFGLKHSSGDRVTLIKSEDNVVVESLSRPNNLSSISNSNPQSYRNSNNDDDSRRDSYTSNRDVVRTNYHNDHSNSDSTTTTIDTVDESAETESRTGSEGNLTPRQALKQRSFYALIFFKMVQIYGFFILNNYYKTFGLLFIHDDHFLTAIVMIQCLVTPVCTWIAGFALDKFGIKPTLTVISSIFCIVASFFYLTPLDKWLYLFACLVNGGSMFTLFCVTGACCVKLFGETHFTTIYGMTFIPCYVIVPLLPPLTEWIISTFGWFVLFISVGFLALINVFTLLWGLPRERMCC